MEIRELCDFIIQDTKTGNYVVWGRPQGATTDRWCLTDNDTWASPMTYLDADSRLESISKDIDGTFQIVPRQKTGVTLTKV